MPRKRTYKRKKYKSKKSRSKKKRIRGGSKRIQKGGYINPLSAISTFVDAIIPSSSPTTVKTPLKGGSIQLHKIRKNYNKLIKK